MITQIEIDGFKTFKDFKVELAPFQVIVGPNGSGKSNLFDALQLVSQSMLPGGDVYTTMKGIRGEAGELFTKYPDGSKSDTIRIAVEMLVDGKEHFSDGREIDLKFARFRYELEIRVEKGKDDFYQKYFENKQMTLLPNKEDKWCIRYNISPNTNISLYDMTLDKNIGPTAQKLLHGTKSEAFKVLKEANNADIDIIKLYKDHHELHTIYSSIIQKELRSLSFYHLNPEALRKHSSTTAPPYLAPDGSNLPATLARIKAEDPLAFQLISYSIASPTSDILSVDVEKHDIIGEYLLCAKTSAKHNFTAKALSDSILRLLALATLRNDPQFHGTICIEEPENGVHPLYLHKLARLLHDTATDFADPERVDEPLRQVIVTTHSPTFISQPEVIDHLLLATTPTRVSPQTQSSMTVTRMDPVITPKILETMDAGPDENRSSKYYTIDMVRQYLDGDTLQQADKQLKEARTNIHKKILRG